MTFTAPWIAWAIVGVALVVMAIRTASRPVIEAASAATAAERAAIWQQIHRAPEVDPLANPLQRAFLAVTYRLAYPLARRGVKPDVLTIFGLWVAALTPLLAAQRSHWPAVAGLVLVASSFLDGIDGAVAGLTQRTSWRGHVLDSVVDRLSEALFVAAIVLAGATSPYGMAAMGAIALHEYTRARAAYAFTRTNQSEVGVITVGERPTRVIGSAIALLAMGVAPRQVEFVGNASLIVVTVATLIGWLQLSRHLYKSL